ncbi:MAG: hypothetical protein GY811_05215 [Myxococcales bacterium]|nr:hypothetical protein [Myxococcales bacterium]
MTIAELIDKQDTVEIVRDQISAILAVEVESQKTLAALAGEDPDGWDMRVFMERSNPWEQFLNDQSDGSPIVNVWWDNSTFDPKVSTIVERQKSDTVFNVDCYGYGKSADDPAGGHVPGDREAAINVAKAVKLVRNILMAAEYTYLGIQGTVFRRWVQSITSFQPSQDAGQMQQIVGVRIAFRVEFNEFSPQIPLEILETLSAEVARAEDGQVIAQAQYSY